VDRYLVIASAGAGSVDRPTLDAVTARGYQVLPAAWSLLVPASPAGGGPAR